MIDSTKVDPALLGPAELGDGESPFLLAGGEWLTLQRYVNEALTLPIDALALRRELGMNPSEPTTDFDAMLESYGAINAHCRTWRDQTFPASVNLADAIVHYNQKVPDYYGALRDLLKHLPRSSTAEAAEMRADARDIIEELSADAQTYADQAATVQAQIVEFSHATKNDQLAIKRVHDTMTKTFGDLGSRIEAINGELTSLRKEIDQLNKEYEHSVVVASTTVTYAWVMPFGLVAAAIVAGIYGDSAVKLKQRIDTARTTIAELDGELHTKTRLKYLMGKADDGIDGIISLIDAALPIIQKIEGVWRAIANDFTNLLELIDSIEYAVEERLRTAYLRVGTAIAQWESLAHEADQYRVNAFIDVPALD